MRLVILGFLFGFFAGDGVAVTSGLVAGGRAGDVAGIVAGLGLALMTGLKTVPDDLAVSASPVRVLKRDRRLSVVILGCGAALDLAVVVAWRLALIRGVSWGVIGLAYILVAAFCTSVETTEWPLYMFARTSLALRGQLPWRLTRFLADAHRRGVLWQAGSVYQFRHIDLRRRLASRPDR
jgi:hypothetical protein